jgi:hypothetical protein
VPGAGVDPDHDVSTEVPSSIAIWPAERLRVLIVCVDEDRAVGPDITDGDGRADGRVLHERQLVARGVRLDGRRER